MTSVSNVRKPATWHATAPISDVLTVTIMDMSHWIALTKYHLQAHQQDAGTTPLVGMTDQHLRIIATPSIPTMTIGTGTDLVNLDLTHITLDIEVSYSDSLRSCSRSFHHPSHHSSSCHRKSSTYHYHQDITHCRSSSCRNFSRGDSRSRTHKFNKHHYKLSQRSSSSSLSTPWKPTDRRYKQVTIDDPPLEYYSADDLDSDSEDDLN